MGGKEIGEKGSAHRKDSPPPTPQRALRDRGDRGGQMQLVCGQRSARAFLLTLATTGLLVAAPSPWVAGSCGEFSLHQAELFRCGSAQVVDTAWNAISFHFLSSISSAPQQRCLRPFPGVNIYSVPMSVNRTKILLYQDGLFCLSTPMRASQEQGSHSPSCLYC